MTAVEQYDTANWGYDRSRTVQHLLQTEDMTEVEQYDTANWGYDRSRTVRHLLQTEDMTEVEQYDTYCKLRIWQK